MGAGIGTEPFVSVIVPVRDRRDLLVVCLDGLAAQTYGAFEVIVVDDGSADGSAEAAERYAARPTGDGAQGPAVRVVRLPRPGPGAVRARQRGIAAAVGEILAFTDSDCVPARDWLERGVAAITAGADVVQGRTEPTRPRRPLERSLWVGRDDGLFPTCNVLYRREAFDLAGGFEPAGHLGFRFGARARDLGMGEDTLLGWRVRRAGPAVFAPDVVVRHAVFPADLHANLTRMLQAGAIPALVREVPELRDTLLAGRYFLGTTRIPLYAGFALAAARHPRLALGAGGVWAARHWLTAARSEPSRARRAAALPALLALDAGAAASLLVGSARARTLVL